MTLHLSEGRTAGHVRDAVLKPVQTQPARWCSAPSPSQLPHHGLTAPPALPR